MITLIAIAATCAAIVLAVLLALTARRAERYRLRAEAAEQVAPARDVYRELVEVWPPVVAA